MLLSLIKVSGAIRPEHGSAYIKWECALAKRDKAVALKELSGLPSNNGNAHGIIN